MTRLMKAARMVAIGKPLEITEIPVPALDDEDVLVRIARCGFNGGDPHLISGDFRESPEFMPTLELPMTFGHNGSGVVAEVGLKVEDFHPGERVFVATHRSCGRCRYCQTGRSHLCQRENPRGWITYKHGGKSSRYRDGFAAQYALTHHSALYKLPDSINFDVGCHLVGVGVVYLAAKRGKVGHGDIVVITGATGRTGAAAVLVVRMFNPRRIIAVARDRKKLDYLSSLDPRLIKTIAVTREDLSSRLKELTEGEGADVLLDFVPRGVETTCQVIYRMRPGGRVVLVGGCTEELRVSYRYLMRSSIELTSSKGSDFLDFPVLTDAIVSGKLDLSSIDVLNFPLEQANDALKALIERKGNKPFWVSVLPNSDLAD
jgi:threonine dehydrogenase-like Zn-dependent dehydrogenase